MTSEEDKPPSNILERIKKFISFKPQSLNEVSEVLEHALTSNIIDKEAQLIAEKAIRLGNITLKEIMVPKIEMVTININDKESELLNRIIDTGHSRYPVLGNESNEVLGLLLAKDILPIMKTKQKINLSSILRDVRVVPENKKADTMLEEFKKDRSHMAVVIDEYGTISGLITIEDVLEELVGEIEDEHDPTDADEIIQVSKNEFIADARLELSVFEKKFDKNFDDINAETLGGLFIYKLCLLYTSDAADDP